jgi:hypothetical protein
MVSFSFLVSKDRVWRLDFPAGFGCHHSQAERGDFRERHGLRFVERSDRAEQVVERGRWSDPPRQTIEVEIAIRVLLVELAASSQRRSAAAGRFRFGR